MQGVLSKRLSVFSLVMINVIAVDNLKTLPAAAQYGFSLLSYYLLAALLFFIPTALVTAELATAWPKRGGIYVWVKAAFGQRKAFMVVWMQWIYNIVWYPTILSLVASTIFFIVDPGLADNKIYMMSVVTVIFWGCTLVNFFGIRVSSFISTFGTLLGTLFPMMLIIMLAGIWVWQGNPVQVDFSYTNFWPNLTAVDTYSYFLVILFGLLGLEMSAVHAAEVKQPERDYPKALLISVIIILISLSLASLAITIIISPDKLSVLTGLIQAYVCFFDVFELSWASSFIAIAIVLGGISSVVTWIIGPAKGLLVAAEDEKSLQFLQKQNKYGVPTTVLLVQGFVFTILSSAYLFMPEVKAAYWMLSVLTAQLALLMYVFMFAAAIKLRYSAAEIIRPYRIPGGKLGIWLVAGVGLFTSVLGIAIGFIPPSKIYTGSYINYVLSLAFGILFFCLIPWLFMRKKS